MANLLNVVPQAASNKSVSPSEKLPNQAQSDELKELFQQNLSKNLATEVPEKGTEVKAAEPKADLAEVAMAAGAVPTAKITATEIPLEQNSVKGKAPAPVKEEKNSKDNGKDAKSAEQVVAAGIPVQNQLPLKTTMVPVKTEETKNTKNAPVKAAVSAPQAQQQQISKQVIQQPVSAELASAMAGQDLLGLSPDQELDVESLELKNSDSKPAHPKAASSKLSTTDFLNLREISQNTAKSNPTAVTQAAPLPAAGTIAMGMKPALKQKVTEDKDEKKNLDTVMNGLAPAHSDKQLFGKTMDATVSQTHGQKPVLSPESLTQIGNQVNLLGQAKQDGEIKIRLRPDHLGELQMSVRTQGQNVSVQIKAENNEAKKIIEDSLSSLREHLSQQNLSLARIDVVTQTTATTSPDQTQMQFDSNQNFNQSSANADRQNAQDGSQQSRREFYRDEMNPVSVPASMIRPRVADSTRLDLIA